MKGYQHLKKMIEEYPEVIGNLGCAYLRLMRAPTTSSQLASLTAIALKEYGITYHGPESDWLRDGRYFCEMEINQAQEQEYITVQKASELRRQVQTTLTPTLLLRLLCKLWKCNNLHRRHKATRLLKPEDRLTLRPEPTEYELLTA